MRRLLIALVVLVAILVAVDFGLRLLTGYWLGRGLQTSLSLGERPSVSLGDFPFLPELVVRQRFFGDGARERADR